MHPKWKLSCVDMRRNHVNVNSISYDFISKSGTNFITKLLSIYKPRNIKVENVAKPR